MSINEDLANYKKRSLADPIKNFRFNKKLTTLLALAWAELILFGGNRSGKTTYGAYECVKLALDKPGAVVWCCTVDFKTSVRVQQRKVAKFIPPGRARQKYREIKGYIDQAVAITHGPGEPDSVIVFKSYDSGTAKFQSDSCDLVWNDEEPPYDIYQEEMMRLMDRNGRMLTTMTSLNGYTDFVKETYGKWEKGQRHDLNVEFVETEDNLIENGGGLTRAAYERIMEKIPEFDKKTRTKGIPSIRRGVVFKEWEDSPPFVVPRFEVPLHWTRYLVIDPHEATPTAVVMLAFSPKGTCYIYQALFESGTVEQIAVKIGRVEPIKNFRKKLMDHAANVGATHAGGIFGTNIAHRFSLAGITCEMTNSAIKDINSGIDAMRTRMSHVTEDGKPGLVIFDDLVEPRQELKNHSFDDEGVSVRKKNKHFVDCVKYALNYGFKYEAPEPTAEEMAPYQKYLHPETENAYARLEC